MKKVESKCRCGSEIFEEVDVTPAGIRQRRYFMRAGYFDLSLSK